MALQHSVDEREVNCRRGPADGKCTASFLSVVLTGCVLTGGRRWSSGRAAPCVDHQQFHVVSERRFLAKPQRAAAHLQAAGERSAWTWLHCEIYTSSSWQVLVHAGQGLRELCGEQISSGVGLCAEEGRKECGKGSAEGRRTHNKMILKVKHCTRRHLSFFLSLVSICLSKCFSFSFSLCFTQSSLLTHTHNFPL